MNIKMIILISLCLINMARAQELPWTNQCPDAPGCEHVGKPAYNAAGNDFLRTVELGPVIGVAWRPEGSLLSVAPAIPSAGIPATPRLSPRNAWYYIIGAGGVNDKPFLREQREIQPR